MSDLARTVIDLKDARIQVLEAQVARLRAELDAARAKVERLATCRRCGHPREQAIDAHYTCSTCALDTEARAARLERERDSARRERDEAVADYRRDTAQLARQRNQNAAERDEAIGLLWDAVNVWPEPEGHMTALDVALESADEWLSAHDARAAKEHTHER